MRPLLIGLCLATALAGCGTPVSNPVTGRSERTVMSEADELAVGRQAHEQVLREYGVYRDQRLQAYVDEIGQRLARQSHRRELRWTFTLLDSPEVNAFALPGGYIYVTRGLLAHMNSEADLAGVIGHEIGHVTARHSAQRATREQGAGLGVLAASVLGMVLESQGLAGAGQLAGELSQTVAAGYVASYSREQELQADRLGAEYLARSNYDPRHMVDVIAVLQARERFAADAARSEGRSPPAQVDWLASHPTNERRLQDIRQHAGQLAAASARGNLADSRNRYLQAIDGMTFGESPEQGLTRGDNFFHEPLGIAFTAPRGWNIRNSAESIVAINAERDAGLVVRLAPPRAGGHDEILRDLLKAEQGRAERYSLNGLAATRWVGASRDARGQLRRLDATVVTGPTRQNFILLGLGRDDAALRRSERLLQQAVASFRPLTPADRQAARPWALRTVGYPRGGFAELARQSPLDARAEAQLRLLNGAYQGGAEPRPGELVKTVVTR